MYWVSANIRFSSLYILLTLGKSAFSSSIISPQHNSFSNPTNFTSFPWLKLSRIAAFTSPAVLIRCPGDSNSEIPGGGSGADSNASNAIVRSSSAKNSGDSSPRGANSSCANCNASAIRPCRISSINFCCCNLKYNPGFVSRIYDTANDVSYCSKSNPDIRGKTQIILKTEVLVFTNIITNPEGFMSGA